MASYFDLPQQKAGAAHIESVPEEQRQQLGRTSLLSPAVTQLLDDLEQEHWDSDSDEASSPAKNHEPQKSRQGKGLNTHKPAKSSLSPSKGERSPDKGPAHVRLSPTRAGGGGSAKPKQPHMARFHSLRSMLFSNTIEDKMKKMTHEDCEQEEAAANKWKSQHDERQMHNRPKTPEKDAQKTGHGLGSRLKMSIRRMTSKEVPTMETLKEDGAHHDFSDTGSTASSDDEPEPYQWRPRDSDEESIDHSDVEELVRWVSRRDPPSDGEARNPRKAPIVAEVMEDSGHESFGHSDVDELVQWVSRRSSDPETRQDRRSGYSDASTESNPEMVDERDSSEEEDADDLVRWISHREGPNAGPVRHKGQDNVTKSPHDFPVEPERGRPRSRDSPTKQNNLNHDDVDELVAWRKDSKQLSPPKRDQEAEELLRQEDVKKQQLGMTSDEGSLSHSDVKDLIEHVKTNDMPAHGTDPAVTTSSSTKPETGDLRQLRTN